MDPLKLPLLQLFNKLVEAGLFLGIEEYEALLHALQRGFGCADSEALARLCKLLWTTSLEQENIFDIYYEEFLNSLEPVDISQHTLQRLRASQLVKRQPEVSTKQYEDRAPNSSAVASFMSQTQTDVSSSSSIGDFLQLPSLFGQPESSPKIKFTKSSGYTPEQKERNSGQLSHPSIQFSLESQDDLQTLQALKTFGTDADEAERDIKYIMSERYYLPVNKRQLQQNWRTLRWPIREGPLVELDIEGTVEAIGKSGFFLEPILRPRRINQAHLLLLLDYEGSMVPFGVLGRRLALTAIRGGHLKRADIFYFHDCPTQYLYRDPEHQESIELLKLENLTTSRTAALIFSDAGAARNNFSQKRLDNTIAFLDLLKAQVSYVAWLNPLPVFRWFGNTAQDISQHVPMFPANQRGVIDAIRTLRGHQVL